MAVGASYSNASRVVDYTNEINAIPTMFGRIGQMGLFEPEGIATDTVIIDRVQDRLSILPATGRGGPASRARGEKLSSLALQMPYIKHEDFLYPQDVINRRRPGETGGPDTASRKRAKKLATMRMKVQQTHEWLRLGAIIGTVSDGAGVTLLNNYTEFGITQSAIDFELNDTSTDVGAKIRTLKRTIEANLQAGIMVEQVHVFVDSTFFDLLVNHTSVVRAYQQFASVNQIGAPGAGATAGQATGGQPLQADLRRSFVFQGVIFEEYNPTVTLGTAATGTTSKLIADDTGYAFPLNVPEMFTNYYAPANKMQFIETEGIEMYAFEYELNNDEGFLMEAHTAPLPVNRRPAAVVRVHTS